MRACRDVPASYKSLRCRISCHIAVYHTLPEYISKNCSAEAFLHPRCRWTILLWHLPPGSWTAPSRLEYHLRGRIQASQRVLYRWSGCTVEHKRTGFGMGLRQPVKVMATPSAFGRLKYATDLSLGLYRLSKGKWEPFHLLPGNLLSRFPPVYVCDCVGVLPVVPGLRSARHHSHFLSGPCECVSPWLRASTPEARCGYRGLRLVLRLNTVRADGCVAGKCLSVLERISCCSSGALFPHRSSSS